MKRILVYIALTILCIDWLYAQSSIKLRRTFIESYMNRITIASHFDEWYSHEHANDPENDADIHASGYDKKIGMATVAEVMNAKEWPEAIDSFVSHQGGGKKNNTLLDIVGVWRLWPEHMSAGAKFFQEMKIPLTTIKKKKTNPDHIFEIHPVLRIDTFSVSQSIHNITGYTPKTARKAITEIRNKSFIISSDKKTISFSTKAIGNNYIDLWIRIDSTWQVDDGAFAYCRVLDSDFNPEIDEFAEKIVLLVPIRIAFAEQTECYAQLQTAEFGEFMHILGIPRINLANVSWREWMSKKDPDKLKGKLPFEIIAVGIIE